MFCVICCFICGCAEKNYGSEHNNDQNKNFHNLYNICNREVEVEQIYFNDAKGLICSESNPYLEQLLSQIEFVSQEETIDFTQFEFDPEITLVASEDITFELSGSVTHHMYSDEYDTSYYIRVIHDGEIEDVYHYAWDEDVIQLRQFMMDALDYEYSAGIVTNEKGVITFVKEENGVKICGIESTEYGYQRVAVEDYDGVIVGDTVEYTILEKAEDIPFADCVGEIRNLTNNNVAATSEEYVSTLSFAYNVVTFEIEPGQKEFRLGTDSVEYDKEEFDFLLDLNSDEIPADVIQDLKDKYDEDFFENHILLPYELKTTDVEVTAVTQPKWLDGRNTAYVKQTTKEPVPEGNGGILFVEISREGWNEKNIYVYLYE